MSEYRNIIEYHLWAIPDNSIPKLFSFAWKTMEKKQLLKTQRSVFTERDRKREREGSLGGSVSIWWLFSERNPGWLRCFHETGRDFSRQHKIVYPSWPHCTWRKVKSHGGYRRPMKAHVFRFDTKWYQHSVQCLSFPGQNQLCRRAIVKVHLCSV